MPDIWEVLDARHSTRAPFDPTRPIPADDLRRILEAARRAPTAHNMQNYEIVVVEDRAMLERLGELRGEATDEFLRENFAQLSLSVEELERKGTGLLATPFPASWRVPNPQPPPEERAMNFGATIRASAALLLVLYDPRRRAPASEGDFLGAISLGCVMENMWLAAQALGLAVHIVSTIADPAPAAAAKELLAIPPFLRIAYGFCVGYAATARPALRVRRPLASFVHRNRYGG